VSKNQWTSGFLGKIAILARGTAITSAADSSAQTIAALPRDPLRKLDRRRRRRPRDLALAADTQVLVPRRNDAPRHDRRMVAVQTFSTAGQSAKGRRVEGIRIKRTKLASGKNWCLPQLRFQLPSAK